MSALPPKADIVERDRHVRFVPKADIRSQIPLWTARPIFFVRPDHDRRQSGHECEHQSDTSKNVNHRKNFSEHGMRNKSGIAQRAQRNDAHVCSINPIPTFLGGIKYRAAEDR